MNWNNNQLNIVIFNNPLGSGGLLKLKKQCYRPIIISIPCKPVLTTLRILLLVSLKCHMSLSHVTFHIEHAHMSKDFFQTWPCTGWASSCIGLARRTIVSAGVLYFSSTTCKTAPQRHFAMLHQDRARVKSGLRELLRTSGTSCDRISADLFCNGCKHYSQQEHAF